MPIRSWSRRPCASLAGRRPARGAVHGGLELRQRQRARSALVERHDDVGAELLLDAHRERGREHVARAVVHRAELDALVAHHARALEAEHLEPAGVGEDRPVPAHEPVQAAVRGDDVRARAEVQVVGVAEDDLRAELPQLARLHRLDGRLGADRHEAGRLDHAVRRHQTSGAGGSVARLHGELEALGAHGGAGRRALRLSSRRATSLTAPASRRRSCRSGSARAPRGGRPPGSPPRRRRPSRARAGSCAAGGSW